MRHASAILMMGTCLSAGAANLGEIYTLARTEDAPYRAAQQAYRAGLEKREQAKALYRPSITLTANLRENNEKSNPGLPQGTYTSSSAALSLVQPLLRPQNKPSFEQGELQSQLAEQQFMQAEQDLMLRVSRAYFEILQAQDAIAAVGAQKQAFAQQLAQSRRNFEVGVAPITETNEAQSRYDLTIAQEIAATNELEVKRRILEKIINRPAPALAPLDPAAETRPPAVEAMAALVERAPTENLAVAVSRLNREIAEREVTKQSLAASPTFDLTASTNANRNVTPSGSAISGSTHRSVLGVELAWPLYQGGANLSREREAAANLGRAEFEVENARRQATLDARQAYLGSVSGGAMVTALRQAQSSGESQLRSSQRGFEVGTRARVDVLNAQQQLYTTRRDLAAARYQTLIAQLQLKAAANQLSEQDLKALDALLKEQAQ